MDEERVESRSATIGREGAREPEGSTVGFLLRLVVANGPWKMFVSFKAVIATAFATGAYALIFPTIWQIGDTLEWQRLALFSGVAVVAMIFWMIVAHGLWERSAHEADQDSRISATLQNVVTVTTLTTAVLISYAVLFVLLFLAGFLFVPDQMLENSLGRAVNMRDYLTLAWIATSISTITGSLGGGLEDAEAVRESVNVR